MSKKLKRILCFFTKHKFIRFTLMDGKIQFMCMICDKIIIKDQSKDLMNEDYINE